MVPMMKRTTIVKLNGHLFFEGNLRDSGNSAIILAEEYAKYIGYRAKSALLMAFGHAGHRKSTLRVLSPYSQASNDILIHA